MCRTLRTRHVRTSSASLSFSRVPPRDSTVASRRPHMDPERTETSESRRQLGPRSAALTQTSEASVRGCPRYSRSANGCSWGCFHLWLFPLSLHKPLPALWRRTATARSDDDMFFMQLCEFILRRYMRTRAKMSWNSSPLCCGSQKLNPGAPQEFWHQWGIWEVLPEPPLCAIAPFKPLIPYY